MNQGDTGGGGPESDFPHTSRSPYSSGFCVRSPVIWAITLHSLSVESDDIYKAFLLLPRHSKSSAYWHCGLLFLLVLFLHFWATEPIKPSQGYPLPDLSSLIWLRFSHLLCTPSFLPLSFVSPRFLFSTSAASIHNFALRPT